MASAQPDFIVHLAAISFVAHDDSAELYRSNLLGTLSLLEAAALLKPSVRKIILASSANVYGRPARLPVDESAPTVPLNHYAVSKLAMEYMARLWFERLPILIARPFNYTGVGQNIKFVIAKLVRHFRLGTSQIELGDTSAVREFMDVRDVAEIYARLVESDAVGEAVNICSSVGYSVDAVIERLRILSGQAPRLVRSESLRREQEIPQLVGCSERLKARIGALKFRSLDETLAWMLNGDTPPQ